MSAGESRAWLVEVVVDVEVGEIDDAEWTSALLGVLSPLGPSIERQGALTAVTLNLRGDAAGVTAQAVELVEAAFAARGRETRVVLVHAFDASEAARLRPRTLDAPKALDSLPPDVDERDARRLAALGPDELARLVRERWAR
ncbi:hypothetical protein [Pseudonocardia sp. McavD-2-B]|uniref:hypothetical protein n=1 Tax=Pseudonocardia sp. McavD-2-B TaxID=2954499 RepID=UPI0020980EE8|nr:hypothetical protein [Pseudonocardia sp. McavD-2-B]MCO7195048.1 hypothetical protein [Pseudonocardia sp. McavD-2-B]